MLKAIFALQNEVVQVVVQVVSRQGKFVSCFLKLSISLVRNWSTHVVVLQKASLFFLSACRFACKLPFAKKSATINKLNLRCNVCKQ